MEQHLLPEIIGGSGPVLLRRWVPDDAEALQQVVLESLEHLRPWMPWIAEEPLPLQRRREMVKQWERGWKRGGDVYLGVFAEGRAVGSCGLHRRIGPDGLEIGYWIHPAFLRRGLATEVARLLTGAGLSVPGVTHVEIRHDKANLASAGIPRKLGYTFLGEVRPFKGPRAPSETGTLCRWRMADRDWPDRPDRGGVAAERRPARNGR